jgi:hypothetical protein
VIEHADRANPGQKSVGLLSYKGSFDANEYSKSLSPAEVD